MKVGDGIESEQQRIWNGPAGHAWVESQEVLDSMLAPFEALLVDSLASVPGLLLDVGCGTGSTTIALARRRGSASDCTGIDISAPMIATARARAQQAGVSARFVVADAQTHAFDEAAFTAIASRFGVMFFDDPIAAFANLRRAAQRGAVLRFIAWRSAAENAFMTTAERAAAPLLPDLPPRQPGAPGQFAFADAQRIRTILEQSGWSDIDIQPADVECSIREPELARYVTRLGPVGLALHDANDDTRTRVVETVIDAFRPFVQDGEARFISAAWMVGASNGS